METATPRVLLVGGAAGSTAQKSAEVIHEGPDTAAPRCSMLFPLVGGTVKQTYTLAAHASGNVGITRVEFYRGTTLLGSDACSPYSLSWNTTLVANGAYTLTAKDFDAAGHVTKSSSVAVTVANSPLDDVSVR